MKLSALHFVWLLLLSALLLGAAGCASDDPDNNSVRPWGASQNSTAMPIQNEQHSE